jgi:hypothetical protein
MLLLRSSKEYNKNKTQGETTMKKTFKIIKTHTTCGDKFFTVAITNQDGTHTDVFSETLLVKAFAKGATFEVDMENEDVVAALEELGYISVCEEEDSTTEKEVFDVYKHSITVDEVVIVDFAGEFLKTYKTEKAAMNFASKKGFPVL